MRSLFRMMVLSAVMLVAAVVTAIPAKLEPELILPPKPVLGGPDFSWQFQLKIKNPLEVGLFVDSLWVEVKNLDVGETGNPRQTRLPLNIARMRNPAISAGDSLMFAYGGSSLAEDALLTVHMSSHTSTGKRFHQSGTIVMKPSKPSTRTPSETIVVEGHKIEMLRAIGTGPGQAPGAGLVIVHGHGSNARRMLPSAWKLISHGYSLVLVSLPGYGLSPGPTEFANAATLAAIEAALDTVRNIPGVDSARIGLWGVGHGATAAALVAARRPTLAGLVLTGGIYDVATVERETRSPVLRELIRRDVGKDVAAWRRRSPNEQATALGMPVLLVHAREDSTASLAQAQAYENVLRSNGVNVRLAQEPGAGRFVSPVDDESQTLIFFRDHLTRAKTPPGP